MSIRKTADETRKREEVERGVPVNPASFSAETVRRTCSIHGLKQHIRVAQSFCGGQRVNLRMSGRSRRRRETRTRSAFFACSMASHGAGRSRNTGTRLISLIFGGGNGGARTCVDGVFNRKAVFAYVPVRERHDVVHAMPRELLPTAHTPVYQYLGTTKPPNRTRPISSHRTHRRPHASQEHTGPRSSRRTDAPHRARPQRPAPTRPRHGWHSTVPPANCAEMLDPCAPAAISHAMHAHGHLRLASRGWCPGLRSHRRHAEIQRGIAAGARTYVLGCGRIACGARVAAAARSGLWMDSDGVGVGACAATGGLA